MNGTKRTRRALALAFAAVGAFGVQFAMAAPKKVPAPHPKKPAIQAAAKPRVKPAAKHPAKHVAVKHAAVHVVHNVPMPPKRPLPAARSFPHGAVALRELPAARPATLGPAVRPAAPAFAVAPSVATSPADIAAVKRVIEVSRKGKLTDADAAENSIGDPVARKLAEWIVLRSDNTNPSFARYAAFVNANPSWPHAALFRRRAENALWNDNLSDAEVLAFFTNHM